MHKGLQEEFKRVQRTLISSETSIMAINMLIKCQVILNCLLLADGYIEMKNVKNTALVSTVITQIVVLFNKIDKSFFSWVPLNIQ